MTAVIIILGIYSVISTILCVYRYISQMITMTIMVMRDQPPTDEEMRKARDIVAKGILEDLNLLK